MKLAVVLSDHLCEIQLQLQSFYATKESQHNVYEWSRTLRVTEEMQPEHLFKHMDPNILAEMVDLAQRNWTSTLDTLPHLLCATGRFTDARKILVKVRLLIFGPHCIRGGVE